jgi:hypothetical protein
MKLCSLLFLKKLSVFSDVTETNHTKCPVPNFQRDVMFPPSSFFHIFPFSRLATNALLWQTKAGMGWNGIEQETGRNLGTSFPWFQYNA